MLRREQEALLRTIGLYRLVKIQAVGSNAGNGRVLEFELAFQRTPRNASIALWR
ncbi:MAG TPA: hypothetical protein VHK24_13960 [Steroidobacter sp.]|nr:hypothetical protein [Steroidobacter sp.]